MNIAFFLTPKSQVAYIREGSSIRQGLEKMQRHGYTCLPVISKDGRFLGCINEGDFLWNILSMGSVTTKDMERADRRYHIRPLYAGARHHDHGGAAAARNGAELCPGRG